MSTQKSANQCIHNGPAGSRYNSMLDAGYTMLQQNNANFLRGTSNAMIPPIFVGSIPDQVGQDGCIIPGPSIDPYDTKLVGATQRKRGEDFEALVFRKFEQMFHSKLSDTSLNHCHILWQGLKINNFKVEALLSDHPNLLPKVLDFKKKFTTKNAKTYGEADIVVLVKDIGVIVLEIKRTLNKVKDGKTQCHRMADFAKIIFESCSPGTLLPIAKVVIVGESHEGSSGTSATIFFQRDDQQNVWLLYEGAIKTLDNFIDCWEMILKDLKQSIGTIRCSTREFDDFAATITGLWSMTGFNGTLNSKGEL